MPIFTGFKNVKSQVTDINISMWNLWLVQIHRATRFQLRY